MPVDIPQHLRNANYSSSTQGRRILWAVVYPFFRFSPRFFYGWRATLLRLLGAKIGRGSKLYPAARIMFPWNLEIGDNVVVGNDARLYSLGRIQIESSVLVSQGAHLCAGSHDHRQPNYPLVLKPILIRSGAWLAADCFIGPGVTVGAGAVVAARAVVVRNVAPGTVVAGNPARVVGTSP
jgi:putative colanic acid biosynthesis acetyltransferase WcaF